MIDIHSHLIPNVDDGSKSIEDTFIAFEEAKEVGFTDIILTSHYKPEYYETKPSKLTFWKDKLQEVIDTKNEDLKLHSGMEIYISEELPNLIENGKLLRLANSKYMLLELPINSKVNYLDYIIYYLDTVGIKPIIAHPERYVIVQQEPKLIEEWIKKGCLIQCNFGSILGIYGSNSKKIIKHLLKNNLVHFVASDCHSKNGIYLQIPKALKKIKRLVGTEKTYEITTLNPQKILNDEEW